MKKIAEIPISDRPREKLQQKGPEALSDIELIAILLGRGVEGHDVMSVAARVLKVLDNNKEKPDIKELKKSKEWVLQKQLSLPLPLNFQGAGFVLKG